MSVESGAHVIVHNKTVTPYYFDGIDVHTGCFTNILVNRISVSKTPKPFSNCLSDSEIIKLSSSLVQAVYQKYQNYHQKDCFNACYQRALNEFCNCQVKNKIFKKEYLNNYV